MLIGPNINVWLQTLVTPALTCLKLAFKDVYQYARSGQS